MIQLRTLLCIGLLSACAHTKKGVHIPESQAAQLPFPVAYTQNQDHTRSLVTLDEDGNGTPEHVIMMQYVPFSQAKGFEELYIKDIYDLNQNETPELEILTYYTCSPGQTWTLQGSTIATLDSGN